MAAHNRRLIEAKSVAGAFGYLDPISECPPERSPLLGVLKGVASHTKPPQTTHEGRFP